MHWDKLIYNYTYQKEVKISVEQPGGAAKPGPEVATLGDRLDLTTQALQAFGENVLDFGEHTKNLGLKMGLLNEAQKALRKALAEANTLQRTTLQVNRTVGQVTKGNTMALAKMPGSFMKAGETMFQFLETGLHGASTASLKLGTTMKSLGLDIKQLLQLNKSALTVGRMSVGGVEDLNKAILDTTSKTGVSFNRLIGAMDKMTETMRITGALGVTGDALKTQMALIGKLGAGSDSLITEMMTKAFDANSSMASEAMLGIFDKMQAFRRGPTAGGGMGVLETAAASFERVNQTLQNVPLQMRAAILEPWGGFEGFGNLASMIISFRDNMSALDIRQAEANEQYRKTFEEFSNEVLRPLQIIFTKVFTGLIATLTFLATPIRILIKTLMLTKTVQGLIWAWEKQKAIREDWNFKRLTAAIKQNTMVQLKKAHGGGLGKFAGVGALSPHWAAITVVGSLVAAIVQDSMMAEDISEINRKTLDPHKFTSMFADRTSELIKQGVATTIFGGNELLAAINTSTEEQASQMGQLLTFFLESTDRGSVPALGGP